MNKFIVGESVVTDEVNLLNTLLFEVFDMRPQPWVQYQVDSGVVVVQAREQGVAELIQLPAGQGRHPLHLINEPEGFSLDVVESTLVAMLGAAACGGLPILDSLNDARKYLTDLPNDQEYSRSLTSDEIPKLPPGLGLAICLPEYLGAVAITGLNGKLATQWGIMLFDFRRTMALYRTV